jgi:hypothetical protein
MIRTCLTFRTGRNYKTNRIYRTNKTKKIISISDRRFLNGLSWPQGQILRCAQDDKRGRGEFVPDAEKPAILCRPLRGLGG